jgi:hypothetical protein
MLMVAISPQGQVTLPNEVLQMSAWRNSGQLVLECLGDTVVLRPANYQKTDDISDLGGFFKNNTVKLTTAELCEPVQLTKDV